MKMKVQQTGKYIGVLYRLISRHMACVLSKYELNNIDYMYLMVLMDGSKKTQEELTRIALVDKAQTTRAVKHLLSKGLIERISNPKDKRSNLISLTEAGLELAPKVYKEIEDMETQLNEGFDKKKQRELTRDLIKMVKNMR